jgi:dTDP-4-amino-4,6-dideoxygalactose transaminase
MSQQVGRRVIQAAPVTLHDEDKQWVLGSGQLLGGPYVGKFEEAFSRAHGVRYAVAVSSGNAALTW